MSWDSAIEIWIILWIRDERGLFIANYSQPIHDRHTIFRDYSAKRELNPLDRGFQSIFEAIEREQGTRGNL